LKTVVEAEAEALDVFNDVKLTATPKGSRQSMNPYICPHNGQVC
jgi:hypothetical protein